MIDFKRFAISPTHDEFACSFETSHVSFVNLSLHFLAPKKHFRLCSHTPATTNVSYLFLAIGCLLFVLLRLLHLFLLTLFRDRASRASLKKSQMRRAERRIKGKQTQ